MLESNPLKSRILVRRLAVARVLAGEYRKGRKSVHKMTSTPDQETRSVRRRTVCFVCCACFAAGSPKRRVDSSSGRSKVGVSSKMRIAHQARQRTRTRHAAILLWPSVASENRMNPRIRNAVGAAMRIEPRTKNLECKEFKGCDSRGFSIFRGGIPRFTENFPRNILLFAEGIFPKSILSAAEGATIRARAGTWRTCVCVYVYIYIYIYTHT